MAHRSHSAYDHRGTQASLFVKSRIGVFLYVLSACSTIARVQHCSASSVQEPTRVRLIFKGKVMKDGTTVGECGFRLSLWHISPSYNYSSPMLAGVEAGNTIHMVVVPAGTVPSSPPQAAPAAPAAASSVPGQRPTGPAAAGMAAGAPAANPFGGMGPGGMSPEMMGQMMDNPMMQVTRQA